MHCCQRLPRVLAHRDGDLVDLPFFVPVRAYPQGQAAWPFLC